MHVWPCGIPEGKLRLFIPNPRPAEWITRPELWNVHLPVQGHDRSHLGFNLQVAPWSSGSGLSLHLDGHRNRYLGVELDRELMRPDVLDHLAGHLPAIHDESHL